MSMGRIVQEQKKETIELSLPVNPAYVSSARLTASSIANRMGFDTEGAEDIKSAVSEACAYLINNKAQSGVANFKILFMIYERKLEIEIVCEKGSGLGEEEEDDYCEKMILALMDAAELTDNDDGLRIFMSKLQ